MFLRNEIASDSDEVYRFSKYDGGSVKGGKRTLPWAQQTEKVEDVWLLL